MRLPTKTEYALRALYDMAFHCGGGQAQAKEIADRQAIPIRYLEQILQDLRRAGIIDAQRGPRGGYMLARPPTAITVGHIVRALEGAGVRPLPDAAGPSAPVPPDSAAPDVPALLCDELAAKMTAVLDESTLQDFVDRAEAVGLQRAAAVQLMYFI